MQNNVSLYFLPIVHYIIINSDLDNELKLEGVRVEALVLVAGYVGGAVETMFCLLHRG